MDESLKIDENILLENIGKIAYSLDRAYLTDLSSEKTEVVSFDNELNSNNDIGYAANIRVLRVKRCVIDKEERVIDCFKNIIGLFVGKENTIAVVFKRTPKQAEMFFVVKTNGEGVNEKSKNNIELLNDSIEGNFPGTETEIISPAKAEEILSLKSARALSVVAGIPSEKSKEYKCQGIEKLLNGIVPKSDSDSYSIMLLAESVSYVEIQNILRGYEELATALAPYAGHQFQTGKSENEMKGVVETLSHSEGISNSVTKTHSLNIGVNGGVRIKEIGEAGINAGYGYSYGRTEGKNVQDGKATSTNNSIALGTSKNVSYTYKFYQISDLIVRLEEAIKRIEKNKSNGLWNYAAYILSNNARTTVSVANFFRSISQGDESYKDSSFIQTWVKKEKEDIWDEIIKYINSFSHPIFKEKTYNTYVTPAVNATMAELSNVFSFPKTSVPCLPVIECASFGREPNSIDELGLDTDIGHIYHMHKMEEKPFSISKNELTGHTFITGTTGTGKSNAIYTLLKKLCLIGENQIKFLVIEPSKGEYKKIFGSKEDVYVYGTNVSIAPLLRINPFSFPKKIHVLEHLDRLVEIFNVCWPMYAAMPAVLKNAIERSYEDCGWDLTKSTNEYGNRFYPNFNDVARNVKLIMDSSEYDADNKGAYKGALLTRLNSLTNGINGLIFSMESEDEIAQEVLFDKNVIVDLSRVGSSETKSLLMGMLVLKLQEYRMSCDGINEKLKHLTVLEEAHNLLRSTPSVQSAEVSNLFGKSVEMIANAIAEMRTYGEGFIIADQAPALLDMSVIRNTNTKIIMRLPDRNDRELVGKAANLNDIQIMEISKFPKGVAAIYQSEWIQPVLCKFDKYCDGNREYSYEEPLMWKEGNKLDTAVKIVQRLLRQGTPVTQEVILSEIHPAMQELKLSTFIRVEIEKILCSPSAKLKMSKIGPIMGELFPKVRQVLKRAYSETSDPQDWTRAMEQALYSELPSGLDDEVRQTVIQSLIIDYLHNELGKTDEVEQWKEAVVL
jgi:hypothetical protein